MIRRYLARRKMRWAVRWIRRRRLEGYPLRATRMWGTIVAMYTMPSGGPPLFSPEAMIYVMQDAQED